MFHPFKPATHTTGNPSQGIITETIHPNNRWRVSFEATYWFAQSKQPVTLKPGDCVRVLGRSSTTTLLVEPV